MKHLTAFFLSFLLLATAHSQDMQGVALKNSSYAGLEFRGIGPALMSGRIVDFAVNPENRNHYFVATASGGVWKTMNAGTTWSPVFDKQGSYSIGCVTLDPRNANTVWVGTGENNSQRSVSFGDGVYKSEDGGKSWKNMGLKKSEHIARIIVHPTNSEIIYVAAQGPLWGPGGDRGLYKSSNGGKDWEKVLDISENTGVTDVVMDPRDPKVLYAASYQRRRHVWTLVNGGPESAIYKSTDAGKNWKKLKSGLPSVDMGRIGLAIAPSRPDVVYAIIEAAGDKGGFFRSTDRGATWSRMNPYKTVSAQYYNEIFVDPVNPDKVFSLDTQTKYTLDGGKTWTSLGNKGRHVDDHALWLDPKDARYILIGGDGGIYESFDKGANWLYKANLPVTQFYRVGIDNDYPFYHLYGGTQDNNTIGGPSATINLNGIMNQDWFITQGGDGFQSAIDPKNPDIVYSQYQYGGLIRYDRKSGERTGIRPVEKPGEKPYRWNWDAPLIISPHSNTRLYFAANILFRSDDRGDSWKAVSPDLTRQLDRNKLPVFGKIQSMDAVAKNASTSVYGNIVSISESPLKEGLIYVGTDDGLLQVTDDGGQNWRKIDKFPDVPELAYVTCVLASRHDVNTVYVSFDNRKGNDFTPYILKSTDKGKTWKKLSATIPERNVVWTIAEDARVPALMFIGTEFGVFFTRDGGSNWVQLKAGIPTIAVRDIKVQDRECDLVLATFGRGFYILDDYSPLRLATAENFRKEALIFPVKDALIYVPRRPLGGVGTASQGNAFFTAPNPDFGAVFTYFYRDSLPTLRQVRQQAEKAAIKKGEEPEVASYERLALEDNEEAPWFMFVVRDQDGNIMRQIKSKAKRGINRVNWDLRMHGTRPVRAEGPSPQSEYSVGDAGFLALPGDYTVEMLRFYRGELVSIAGPVGFKVVPLMNTTLPAADRKAAMAFQMQVAELQRAALGAERFVGELKDRLRLIMVALDQMTGADPAMMLKARQIETSLRTIQFTLTGNPSLEERNEPEPPTVVGRISTILYNSLNTTAAPTQTHLDSYTAARAELEQVLQDINRLVDEELKPLEQKMEAAGAPWTPGRLPVLR